MSLCWHLKVWLLGHKTWGYLFEPGSVRVDFTPVSTLLERWPHISIIARQCPAFSLCFFGQFNKCKMVSHWLICISLFIAEFGHFFICLLALDSLFYKWPHHVLSPSHDCGFLSCWFSCVSYLKYKAFVHFIYDVHPWTGRYNYYIIKFINYFVNDL